MYIWIIPLSKDTNSGKNSEFVSCTCSKDLRMLRVVAQCKPACTQIPKVWRWGSYRVVLLYSSLFSFILYFDLCVLFCCCYLSHLWPQLRCKPCTSICSSRANKAILLHINRPAVFSNFPKGNILCWLPCLTLIGSQCRPTSQTKARHSLNFESYIIYLCWL